jgi:glycine cleavage system H protein
MHHPTPNHLRYTKDHEWLEIHPDGTATIGITDYAQHALGDLVFVELPAIGSTIAQGKQFAVVESVKAASEVYAPVSGTVTEVNSNLQASPELINTKPYTEGWIAKVKLSGDLSKTELLLAADYDAFIKSVG